MTPYGLLTELIRIQIKSNAYHIRNIGKSKLIHSLSLLPFMAWFSLDSHFHPSLSYSFARRVPFCLCEVAAYSLLLLEASYDTPSATALQYKQRKTKPWRQEKPHAPWLGVFTVGRSSREGQSKIAGAEKQR